MSSKTNAQCELTDVDGVMLTCAYPPQTRWLCTLAITAPKGKHNHDTRYLCWYKDGGFVVSFAFADKVAIQDCITALQAALERNNDV